MVCRLLAVLWLCVAVACQSGDVGEDEPPVTSTTEQAVATSGANYTFAAGSLIIPTDTTYQDNGIFLAYGLVYRLLQNKIPVSWVIKSGKKLSTISPTGATRSGTTATFTTTGPHALAVGDRVTIRDVGVAAYNGTWTVSTVPTSTTFTVTLATTPSGNSGDGTVTPADFVASATDKQGGPAIVNYAYRGGPFVIDQPDVAAATSIVDAWQAANPTVKVHVATTAFTGYVKRQLVAAPTIAQFDDGNASIATAYLNAAKIPDSQNLAWTAASVDLLTPAEVAGPSCVTTSFSIAAAPNGATSSGTTATITTTAAHNFTVGTIVTIAGVTNAGYNGTWTVASVVSPTQFTIRTISSNLPNSGGGTAAMNDCRGTSHNDGALFDSTGVPAYCQMMSMHWGVANAASMQGREVVREYRRLLQFPTHLFAECQAVNAIENNTNPTVTIAASPGGATSSGTTATFTTIGAHLLVPGESVLVAGVTNAGYNGTWIVATTPTVNVFTATITSSNLPASGGGTIASYNGLFLTRTGYSIGIRPAEVDSFNYDQPYAQMDGYFQTTGGSEPSYTIPAGGGYKAQDVVMLTERKAVPASGTNDVWMTGFLDGGCTTTSEFCDPSFAQGKVSYLGGHDYGTSLPISNGTSQGARLFLNALLEAPCATDLGVASLNLNKTGPLTSNSSQVTYTITAFNNGSSVAGNVAVTDTLVANASFVPAASQRTISSITRATNVVTVTTSAPHPFVVGNRVIITGVTNASFDGVFVVTAVGSTTQFQFAQAGANATSSGGRVALGTDGVCVGTLAQCGGSGGGVVTFAIGAVSPSQTTSVTVTLQFSVPAIYSNTAVATYKAGSTTFNTSSNTTTTCYYAGNPSVCGTGGDPNAPTCSNGRDDDGDGVIDFPDDPGCASAVDTDEADVGPSAEIKGRVLIVFDTSGSMMWNTCRDDFTGGDGSLACPGNDVACAPSPPGCSSDSCGNGRADDSRIQKVKTGITNAVSGFGEIEWGLMRFKQLPTSFSCGTLNVNRNDGGWQGAGASPCTGFNAGDLLVKFDPEGSNDILGWMDGSSNYQGTPPVGKDFELRASGNTPLAGSLASARTYISTTRNGDAVATCRPYRIILVTDGAETCAGNPVTQAALLAGDGVPVHVIGFSTPDPTTQSQLNAIAQAGGTGAYVPADSDAQLSAAIEQIVQSTILVEKCNDLDDDCDIKVDENFPDKGAACNNGAKGVCFRGGQRVCDTPGGAGTHCDAPAVTCADLGTCTEVCNNLDDDCDGKIDESPAMNCQPCVPVGETCNNKDDDCDTLIDEGISRQCGTGTCVGSETCSAGQFVGCSAQQPMTETCNGADDDCDGVCDGFQLGCSDIIVPNGPASDNPGDPSNSPIPQNICRPGTKTCPVSCGGTNNFGQCSGEIKPCNGVVPCTDPCNGLDDDCDNKIDEDFVPADCSTNCGIGTTTCTNGQVSCNSVPAASDTTCNNIDEDCDNKFDEDWACDPSPTCTGPQCCACGTGTTCEQTKCINGVPTCEANPPLVNESCNCNDDDCDTKTDEGTLCPSGATCTNCQCAFPCAGGEFPCPLAKKCENGFCVNDPCYSVTCPAAGNGDKQTCVASQSDPNGYSCVPACSLVTCAGGLVCYGPAGECRPDNCTTFPERCATNESCVNGTCVGDPCNGVTCNAGAYCVGGACVESCADVTCPAGKRCRLGMCEDDPCGQPCPVGQVCHDDTGKCIPDPCATRECPQGQWCNPNDGFCEDDPCVTNHVVCPGPDQICRGGTCDVPEEIGPDGGTTHVTVGGGGGCAVGGDAGWLIALALLFVRRRAGGRS